MENYYNKLNLAIKSSLDDVNLQFQFKYFDEITKLAYIIVENTPELKMMKYSSGVELNTSVEIVASFFASIKPEYCYMFRNILQEMSIYNGREEHAVKFYKIISDGHSEEYMGQNRSNKSEVRKDGSVHIDYAGNIDDIFTIAHEMTHKFSQQKNQDSIIKQFLGETTTITMELLLQDYLLKNTNYSVEEIIAHKNNRLIEAYDDAGAVIFENILLKLYQQNNNHITQDVLLKYLNSLDKNSKIYNLLVTSGEKYLDDIVKSGSLQFYKRQRYVIGMLLACDFHSKIKNNKELLQQLYYLINILGHTDIMADSDIEVLNTLDIPIIDKGEIKVNSDSVARLSDCYGKDIDDNLSYQIAGIRK